MTPVDRPADEGLDQAERLQELGRISGELLHDLAGLLAVTGARISLAVEEAHLGRLAMEELSRIQDDMNDLRQMVREVMHELRGDAFSPENTFVLARTVEQVVHRWVVGAPAVTTTFHSSVPEDVEVAGPVSFFARSLANLLRNAARHARSQVRITMTLVRDDRWVEILVDDDGDGVTDDMMHRLFDPFVTGQGSGTGLGLSFARWGIERLGGKLSVGERARGLGGASFQLLLPLAGVAQGSAPSSRPDAVTSDGAPASDPRILARPEGFLSGVAVAVVDDDLALRQVFVRLLNRAGAVATGIDPLPWQGPWMALTHLEREAPDVILLDLNMGPLDGMEVYGMLMEASPDLARRVIFLTGGDPPDPSPDRPVLSKLVTWDELSSCIHAVAHEELPEA
jgi:CheY-like chemotaxis protein